MTGIQFRKRTSALKIPKEIYDQFDIIVKECQVCQKSEMAPQRSRVSGIRSEIFGELTFIDHGTVTTETGGNFYFLIILAGATNLTTAFAVKSLEPKESLDCLREYYDIYQLNPKSIVEIGRAHV